MHRMHAIFHRHCLANKYFLFCPVIVAVVLQPSANNPDLFFIPGDARWKLMVPLNVWTYTVHAVSQPPPATMHNAAPSALGAIHVSQRERCFPLAPGVIGALLVSLRWLAAAVAQSLQGKILSLGHPNPKEDGHMNT